jgi:hypothetical protein
MCEPEHECVRYLTVSRDKTLNRFQGLCSSGQFNWDLLSDQGRLHEPPEQRSSFYLGG